MRGTSTRTFWLTSIFVAASLGVAVEHLAAQAAPTVAQSAKVHAGLYEITSSTEDGSIWVAAVGSDLVPGARLIALDPATLEERRSLNVEEAAAFGLAINNRTQTLYTSNTRDGSMSAVDLGTGEVTNIEDPTAEGPPHLYRVLVDEANNLVYSSVTASPGSIWVVNGATNQLDRIIENVGSRPTGLALDPEVNQLYVANQADNEIAVIDLATDRVINRIATTGERSTQLAFDPATKRLFVGNQGTNDISVIDTRSGSVIRRVATGAQPVGVAFHPETNRIYVAARADGVLTVIDGATYERIADLEIGTYPNTIHIDPSSGDVYVTNKAERSPRGEPPRVDPNGDKVTVLRP
jgi:YVTN family beta-propeller protein